MLRRLGRTEGSVKDRIEKLRHDLAYPNPESDESRAQIMRDIEFILRDAEKRAALLFDKHRKLRSLRNPIRAFSNRTLQQVIPLRPPMALVRASSNIRSVSSG